MLNNHVRTGRYPVETISAPHLSRTFFLSGTVPGMQITIIM
jgi:hypothetical protein